MNILIGITFDGDLTSVVLGVDRNDGSVHLADKLSFLCDDDMPALHRITKALDSAHRIMANNRLSSTQISAVGISFCGPVNTKDGIVVNSPNMYAWNSIPISSIVADSIGAKCYLQNDANACALAEWLFGNGKGMSDMIFATFTSGMGAGLIINNKLYAGCSDLAGEIGNLRLASVGPAGHGKLGSFEGFCSTTGILQLAETYIRSAFQNGKQMSFCDSINDIHSVTVEKIFSSAAEGDETALTVINNVGYYLGRGLSILIDILNPQAIIVGGIYTKYHNLLCNSVRRSILSEAVRMSSDSCRILPSAFGETITDYAGLAVAYDRVRNG